MSAPEFGSGWKVPAFFVALGLPGVLLYTITRYGEWRIRRFGERLNGGSDA